MFEKDESVKYKQGVEMGYTLALEQLKKALADDDLYGGFREDLIEHLNNEKQKAVNEYMKKYLHLED